MTSIDWDEYMHTIDVSRTAGLINTLWGSIEPRKDIADALPYLINLAERHSVIVELGCECGHGSTRAFSVGLELNPSQNKRMVSVDIRDAIYPDIRPRISWWSMVVGDSRSLDTLNKVRTELQGRPIELLFVDSEHQADQVRTELDLWLPLCRQDALVVFHDTNPEAPYPYPEYAAAVKEYAAAHEFEFREVLTSGQGLAQMWRKN